MNKENTFSNFKQIFVYDEYIPQKDFEYIRKNFIGKVITVDDFNVETFKNCIVYLCGDIQVITKRFELDKIDVVQIVQELSKNYDLTNYQRITIGEIPINIFNVGIFFRKLFNSSKDYYREITLEHEFQRLGMSDKPGQAYRNGIYLTHVKESEKGINFKLLRCSTNLHGPTDNFRDTDKNIIERINSICDYSFCEKVNLNHVLAQTYHNVIVTSNEKTKEKKAKIAEHSDKTKDMPKNGVIAFCSFYEGYVDGVFNPDLNIKKSKDDPYDYCYKNISVLTKLRFRLKNEVKDSIMEKSFDIVMYPNSVFIIPLSTNRLYTHEIIPPNLPVDRLPTRMGYIIRCSNTNAIFKNNKTYIVKNLQEHELEEPTKKGLEELRELYYKENTTIEMVDYNDRFFFSMNRGDYQKPLV